MYYTSTGLDKVHVLFFYRNFASNNPLMCHIGLGVNALHCVKNLRQNNVRSDVFAVWTPVDVDTILKQYPTCTHCIIQAPWIGAKELMLLMRKHYQVHFVVRVHSQVAFLQVEAGSIKIIRDILIMQENELNVVLSCNSVRANTFFTDAYTTQPLYLPNMYVITNQDLPSWRSPLTRDVIRIASFGATRLMKNHLTAAASSLLVAKHLGNHVEFYISVGRDTTGTGIIESIRNLYRDLPFAKLIENQWEDWPNFKRTIASMQLNMQLSMSETFNITTADSCMAGIPSVVSDAIEWVPSAWDCNIDDPEDVARVAISLLSNSKAGSDGRKALIDYNTKAVTTWLNYLSSNPTVF
jgi:hypothetical protein